MTTSDRLPTKSSGKGPRKAETYRGARRNKLFARPARGNKKPQPHQSYRRAK